MSDYLDLPILYIQLGGIDKITHYNPFTNITMGYLVEMRILNVIFE